VFGRRTTESTTPSDVTSPTATSSPADRLKQWKRQASSDNTTATASDEQAEEPEASPKSEGVEKETSPNTKVETKPKPERESTPTRTRGREPSPIADRLRRWKTAGTAAGVPSYLANQNTGANLSKGASPSTTSSYVASLKTTSRAGSAPPRSPGRVVNGEKTNASKPGVTSTVETPQVPGTTEAAPKVTSNTSGSSDGTRRFGRQGVTLTTSSPNATTSTAPLKKSSQRSMSPLIASRMKAWQNKSQDNNPP